MKFLLRGSISQTTAGCKTCHEVFVRMQLYFLYDFILRERIVIENQ